MIALTTSSGGVVSLVVWFCLGPEKIGDEAAAIIGLSRNGLWNWLKAPQGGQMARSLGHVAHMGGSVRPAPLRSAELPELHSVAVRNVAEFRR